MKLQLFAVLLVVAGSCALPKANIDIELSNARNSVEYRIRRFIEQMSKRIENAGFDPLEVEEKDFDINIESLDVAIKAFMENIRFKGASDIRINKLEYSYLFNRLRLDVSLPKISLVIGDSNVEGSVAGREIEGQLKGSLSIKSIRIAGEGYVNVNAIGAISVRSVSLDCSIGDIKSDLSVVSKENDHSKLVNELLNNRIPIFLEDNKDLINGALEIVLSAILNRIWSF